MERIRGAADIPLIPKGVEQVKALKTKLPPIHVAFAPDLKRNQDTAKILTPNVVTDKDLGDMKYGGYEGQPAHKVINQLNAHIANKPDVPLPGIGPKSGQRGESFNSFKNRFLPAVQRVVDHANANPHQNVAAVLNRRAIKTVQAWHEKGSPANHEVNMKTVVSKPGVENGSFTQVGTHKNLYLVRHGETAWNEDTRTPKLRTLRDNE